MSDASTLRMIQGYMEEASAPMFLSSFFRSPPENFHTSEKVSIDIERDEEEIAIVLQDLSTGGRENLNSLYSNKELTPPILDEVGTITGNDLIHRQMGANPYLDPDFAANATRQTFKIARKLERKIRRTVELMASQVLQTGTLDLKDSSGTTLYTLDFGAKGTQIISTGTTWVAGTTALAEISALGDVVRRNGKHAPDTLIFGKTAWDRFAGNTQVKAELDNRRIDHGLLGIETPRPDGGHRRGRMLIGHYAYDLWMYDGSYKDPATGNMTPYVGDTKIVMLSSKARYDLSYGAIPILVPPEQRVMPYLPPRMSDAGRGLDLTTHSWLEQGGKTLKVSIGTRPLTIPTAIDTIGCLDTTQP